MIPNVAQYLCGCSIFSHRFKLNDEWIAMDSSRLRIPVPIQFKEGDLCMARWTDSRKFPARVIKPMDNSKNQPHLLRWLNFD